MSEDRTTSKSRRLPDFQSREALAEFWDTQSFTDYLDDLESAQAWVADDVAAW
jgi:hypothetical protein